MRRAAWPGCTGRCMSPLGRRLASTCCPCSHAAALRRCVKRAGHMRAALQEPALRCLPYQAWCLCPARAFTGTIRLPVVFHKSHKTCTSACLIF